MSEATHPRDACVQTSTDFTRRIERVSGDGPVPLSYPQRRLWFLDRFEQGSSAYNTALVFRLQGDLSIPALQLSLDEVVRRHEALRTTFPEIGGQPVQLISANAHVPIESVDLSNIPPDKRESEAYGQAVIRAETTFDLSRGHVVRASVFCMDSSSHILLLIVHHIAFDGWSRGVLIRELSILYRAFLEGRPSPLTELGIQYKDFSVWQHELLQGSDLNDQISYWRQQLKDIPSELKLPTDRVRPPIQTYRGEQQTITLSRELSDRLHKLSHENRVTLFMTLIAAFQTLLWRHSGQDDFVIGTPIAGRRRTETEGLIGCFINTLAIRCDFSVDLSFRELLLQTRETCIDAYVHQDVPFDRIVEQLQPERNMSSSPVFQVMFSFPNLPQQNLELVGLDAEKVQIDRNTSMFDLTLTMLDDKTEGLSATSEYNIDLFDSDTIQRMLEHFRTLLTGVATDPEQRLSDLPLLTEAELHQLLYKWNDTLADYPQDICIHEVFEKQVQKNPEAVALKFRDRELSYIELNRRANRLANYLREVGVGREVRVAMCMERSIEAVVAILGILKAGGAYVPIDPDFPRSRISFMLENSEAAVVLTQERLVNAGLVGDRAQVICVDDNDQLAKWENDKNPQVDVRPNNLAYVIYTSGSTGEPKGVMVEHRSVVNHAFAMAEAYNLAPSDRVLQFVSISFDVMVEEVFPTLISGAASVIRPDSYMISPAELLLFVERERVTVLNLPTPVWNEWAIESRCESKSLTTPKTLRLVIVGSETCDSALLTAWRSAVPESVRWMNAYGPTEATVTAALYEPAQDGMKCTSTVPIGRPIANARIYILDESLNPVPVGVTGEVYIGGAGVARGYINRPDENTKRFIDDPFSGEPSARLFKTGDHARFHRDGSVEFLGRSDEMIKIRGFRIEPGEIETHLRRHPAVQDAVVIAREDAPGDRRLIAYIVPMKGLSPSYEELRGFLKARLPDQMLPSACVQLDAFLLLPNGKVDRRALPAPEPPSIPNFAKPRTRIESIVADIWAEVLHLDRVGIHEDFFSLGGHSLLATQVISRIRASFGAELPLRKLFESPTVEGLATWIIIMLADKSGDDLLREVLQEVDR